MKRLIWLVPACLACTIVSPVNFVTPTLIPTPTQTPTPDLRPLTATAQQATAAAQLATATAEQLTYETACRQHNGHLSANGNCVVDYPGWPDQRVSIKRDGSWDTAAADSERADCDTQAADAATSAQDGQPWSVLPKYHNDTGVCARGTP